MQSLNNDNHPIDKERMEMMLKEVERANVCSVLMAQLCKELGLKPQETTHNAFVKAFSELQNNSLEYQKEIQKLYITASEVKPKQKRARKQKEFDPVKDVELELEEYD